MRIHRPAHHHRPIRTARILATSLLLACACAPAQELLDAILDRGFVAHWLVCGPFTPDVEGGIATALRQGNAPLGSRDFMAPEGGVARVRPRHLLAIPSDAGQAVWQQAGADGPALDLAPFFAGRDDGVAYAAFYTDTTTRRVVYCDFQSCLGARVWINGLQLRDIEAAPLASLGLTRFVVTLTPGQHLFIFEIPGASFATLADGAGMTLRELGARGLASRTLLTGASGFEMALRVSPATPLGEVYFTPRLENTGGFSGSAGDIRQDVALTLFNPRPVPKPPVEIAVTVPNIVTPLITNSQDMPAETALDTNVALPIGGASAGQSLPVTVQLTQGRETAEFNTLVTAAPPAKGGRVYWVTGLFHDAQAGLDQAAATEENNKIFARQMILRARDPDYGFDLGPVSRWKAAMLAYPEQRTAVLQGIGLGRLASWAAYSNPDERMVTGETLVRNLELGIAAGQSLLIDRAQSYLAWDAPGIAPQTPQLLASAGLAGLVSNVPVPGLDALFWQETPSGAKVLHRREQPAVGPVSLQDLRDRVRFQRKGLLDKGIESDVLVNDSAVIPPEPFLMDASASLRQSYPAIELKGSGPSAFFDDVRVLLPNVAARIPATARAMTAQQPGALVAQPELKRAHAAAERLLLSAEKIATCASLLGANYPSEALDQAWRQVLYWGTPDRLGVVQTQQQYVNALSGCREAASLADSVLRGAAQYVAGEADTLTKAPKPAEGARALVVFNPSPGIRTDLCEATLQLDTAVGLTLLDDAGVPQAFFADQVQRTSDGKIYSSRIRFVAKDIPSMGYRSYYVQPQGPLPELIALEGARIANEFLTLEFQQNTGDIQAVFEPKSSKKWSAGPANRVVALEEDPDKTSGGRELWTTTANMNSAYKPTKMLLEGNDWMQQCTVETPFAGGTLVRRVVLYRGIPRAECEITLDGADLTRKLALATFAVPEAGRTAVFGERFAALAGRRGKGTLDFRTAGLDNPSGTGAQPALNWAALAPGDAITVAGQVACSLGPAAIIHGAAPELEAAARSLQSALIRRGVPAAMWPDTPYRPAPFWDDATRFPNFDADLDHGTAMRFVVGAPDENALAKTLLERLPTEAVTAFERRLPGGALLYFEDNTVPVGYAPVPTLVFGGLTAAETGNRVKESAASIEAAGELALPEEAFLPDAAVPAPDTGMALLFPGTRLCSVERDGLLTMALAHETGRGKQSFRYALYPFAGTWRDARIPEAAEAYNAPLVAALTDLHAGRQAASQSFVELSAPGLVLGAMKAAGYPLAANDTSPRHPRNGFAVRVWDPYASGWSGSISTFPEIAEARRADFGEQPRESLVLTGGSAAFDVGPGAVDAVWLLPAARYAPGPQKDLVTMEDDAPSVHTAYWQHNVGAGPAALPLTVVLRDGMAGDGGVIEAIAANLQPKQNAEGILYVRPAEGWEAEPSHIYYNLAPGEYGRYPISLLRTTGTAEARGAAVQTPYRGRVYRDALEPDAPPPLVEVSRTLSQIKVSVRNRGGLTLEGFVELIVAPRYWPSLAVAPGFASLDLAAPPTVMPRRAPVSLPAYGARDVLFRISDPDVALHGVAKLAANGHVVYAPLGEPAN